jgi:hypothetical protein
MGENEQDPYKTSDTPLAAYLLLKKHKFVVMRDDPNDRKRKVYVFIKQEETDDLVSEFYDGDSQVNAMDYYRAVKVISKKLQDYLRSGK